MENKTTDKAVLRECVICGFTDNQSDIVRNESGEWEHQECVDDAFNKSEDRRSRVEAEGVSCGMCEDTGEVTFGEFDDIYTRKCSCRNQNDMDDDS